MQLENGRFLRITELFAFVSIDDKGHEGIMGISIGGQWIPLIGADIERVEELSVIADRIMAGSRHSYEIRYFAQKTGN